MIYKSLLHLLRRFSQELILLQEEVLYSLLIGIDLHAAGKYLLEIV